MTEFSKVTEDFYVSPQIEVEDLDLAVKEGFEAIIMNRPDGESPGQPELSDIVSRARDLSLPFIHIPITAAPQAEDIQATLEALDELKGKKVLAFCRSGTRSVTLWAYAKVVSGEMGTDAALTAAQGAGYDLSGHRPVLDSLSR